MESETPQSEERRGWRSLSNEQRMAATVLGLCGLAAIGLAFYQMRSGLNTPFMVSNRVLDRSREFFKQQEAEREKEDKLRRQDTDSDGLSDYDELNVHQTSPYLADSDSDGGIDFVEIARGENPNCPKGQDCIGAVSSFEGNASSSRSNVPETESATGTASLRASGDADVLIPPYGSRDARAIREYILSRQLVDPDLLRQIPDDQLIQLYASADREAASSTVLAPTTSTSTVPN